MDNPAPEPENFRKVKHTNQLETYFYPGLFMDEHMNYTWKDINIGHVQVKVHGRHGSESATYAETGQVVWPASEMLSHYLLHHSHLVQSRSVLELGAGVGLPGLVAAKLTKEPSSVVLTDQSEVVLELLQKNTEANFTGDTESAGCRAVNFFFFEYHCLQLWKTNDKQRSSPEPMIFNHHLGEVFNTSYKEEDGPKCALLDWGVDLEEFKKTHGTFDLIIGADIIYWMEQEGMAEPLFQTVSMLLSKKADAMFLLCHHVRSAEMVQSIRDIASKFNLLCAEVGKDDLPAACSDILSNVPLQLLTFTPKDADIII
ncbi:methyltransferase-like protein 23 isoform X1 [Branchiostoma floridae]|uniref:Methyltransferase-like protein 23 isoform X1 n=1 Tax=Branchiostoma floridae TaxID=7739 RepID=A0A9J7MUH1_BRAFL|nr:methyltransferase-like protein 23 isoform X1 [Branchiostoma floridae]